MDRPPNERPEDQPWPTMARLFKTTSAHDEGGERRFSTETLEFRGDAHVETLVVVDHSSEENLEMPADLVLIAAGFVGPELEALGLIEEDHRTSRDTLAVTADWRIAVLGDENAVFACGDAVRGQSLIVWAIAEGAVPPRPLTPISWVVPAICRRPSSRTRCPGSTSDVRFCSIMTVATRGTT